MLHRVWLLVENNHHLTQVYFFKYSNILHMATNYIINMIKKKWCYRNGHCQLLCWFITVRLKAHVTPDGDATAFVLHSENLYTLNIYTASSQSAFAHPQCS